jgi:hypothetical protein
MDIENSWRIYMPAFYRSSGYCSPELPMALRPCREIVSVGFPVSNRSIADNFISNPKIVCCAVIVPWLGLAVRNYALKHRLSLSVRQ